MGYASVLIDRLEIILGCHGILKSSAIVQSRYFEMTTPFLCNGV